MWRRLSSGLRPGRQLRRVRHLRRRHQRGRHVYVDVTDDQALEVAREAYTNFDLNFRTRPGRILEGPSRRGDFDTAIGWGGIYAGSPESVRAQIQSFLDDTGINYFVATLAFGSLTTEQVLRSVRLFTQEVMPALHCAEVSGVQPTT